MQTKNKIICEHCGQSINERQIGLFKGMVDALFDVFKWCKQKNRHEFSRKDIKHLFKNENISARFGDWVFFGGLVYKHGKGDYGLNMERCEDFFSNRLAIPTMVTKHPLSEEITKHQVRTIKQIPSLAHFLDEYQSFVSSYGPVDETIPMF